MSDIQVETGYLRGYAGQLDANANHALGKLSGYCSTHCKNYSGLTSVLYPTRWPAGWYADMLLDVNRVAGNGLGNDARSLREAAGNYDRADNDAAERVWAVADIPGKYREKDVTVTRSGFSGGANLDLAPPPDRKDAQSAKESVYELLGSINDIVKHFTGIDLLGMTLPVVLGEWGALRRIGHAWDELEHAYLRLANDLRDGMNTLSGHWNSGGPSGKGGASRAFDYRIREGWIPAFEALGQACDLAQQVFETIAKQYELVVSQLLLGLNFYVQRIRKAFNGLVTSVNKAKFIKNLVLLVSSVKQLIEDAIRILELYIESFKQMFEGLAAAIVYVRNFIRGDFDQLAIQQGSPIPRVQPS
ncbi:hypothetical protein SMC26_20300 [Actinomadura fulvescens]